MSTRTEVLARFREIVATSGWDATWKAQLMPWESFNGMEIQPPLREVIESDRVKWPRQGQALVPGCGRGNDARFIATSLGLKVIGIDISPTAVEAAQQETPHENVSFRVGDFFASTDEQFDLVYDYTFFVALPPSMRPDWGRQMTKLVKTGGFLITLVFPIDPQVDHGPPFFVRPNHYEEVLGSAWEKVIDEVPTESSPTHVNRERMIVWKRL
ncbi:S-adenosyl-L-methionine-dependent methyltransferase [Suillus clintonianus]|uniref:S-adenosyl-L-methionine-dependent methyltransferase n=1 Tax=Suillus clintonianus TaxID=1904413 RepID=UPI001B88591D|nr:S-adenosyl-L-methionine-dependent methyltransferase [Suillus clintonianus]KAG2146315.1 S-adenosyl-L-methionine-dependent methyltransferase [Suillus clintonianus]